MNKKTILQVLTFLSILFCVFLGFSRISTLEIRMWDEARNAVNALEMLESGFSLVTTYDWNPDHWNTKPPLLIWIQALFIGIGGLTELMIRLPSVLCALAFIPIIISLGKKWKLGKSFSLFSILCLFTFPIFLFVHTFRTGDYDALLCLNMFSYCIFYLLLLNTENKRYLIGFFACLFLAILTKGIAACLLLPGLFFITLLEKKLILILKQKSTYLGIITVILLTFSYYYGRNMMDPGYWGAVVNNELGGRFLETNERHWQPWYFYMHYYRVDGLQYYFSTFFIFAFFAIWSKTTRRYGLYCLILILTHLLIISISQTKLYWYSLPQIPFIALIFGLGFVGLKEKFTSISGNNLFLYIFPFIFLVVPIFDKVKFITSTNNLAVEAHEYRTSRFLIENKGDEILMDNCKVLVRHYYGHVRIYVEQNEELGLEMSITKPDKVFVGDKVLVSDGGFINELKERFEVKLIKREFGADLMIIESEKETSESF